MQFNLSVPLRVTRASSYMSLTAFSILLLLPWSIVVYLKFYHALVPNPILSHNLEFDYVFKNRGPFRAVNSYEFIQNLADIYQGSVRSLKRDSFFRSHTLGDFEITLRYRASPMQAKQDDLVGFRFSVIDDSLLNNELKPWEIDPAVVDEKSKHAKLWPVTDNLPGVTNFNGKTNLFANDYIEWPTRRSIVASSAVVELTKPEVSEQVIAPTQKKRFTFFSSLLSHHPGDNDEAKPEQFHHGVYYTGTRWFKVKKSIKLVPNWIGNHLLPPFVADWLIWKGAEDLSLLQVRFPIKQVNSGKLSFDKLVQESKRIKLILEFANPDLYIDEAKLEFTIKFKGLRAYMYHHRAVCMLWGVLSFWVVSSAVCLVVGNILFFLWLKTDEPTPEKMAYVEPTTDAEMAQDEVATIVNNLDLLLS